MTYVTGYERVFQAESTRNCVVLSPHYGRLPNPGVSSIAGSIRRRSTRKTPGEPIARARRFWAHHSHDRQDILMLARCR
ncbi:MAG: hypothetical protein CM1200mP2_45290 [Planctomycetaceae bacterium]|nr:MAG: hypothetical protein CM1200mP2_45290 [Planctomycetaceae bacterium]